MNYDNNYTSYSSKNSVNAALQCTSSIKDTLQASDIRLVSDMYLNIYLLIRDIVHGSIEWMLYIVLYAQSNFGINILNTAD